MRSNSCSRKLALTCCAGSRSTSACMLCSSAQNCAQSSHSATCAMTTARRPDGRRPSRHCERSYWQVRQFMASDSHLDLFADEGLEPLAGAEQSRRHGLDRATKDSGGIFVAHALDFAEQEGLPELRRQHLDRLFDRVVRLARLRELIRALVVARRRHERLVVVATHVAEQA